MCEEIRKVILDPLSNALHALQMDRCERKTSSCENHCYYHLMPLHHQCINYINRFPIDEETIQYGIRSESFKHLDLPSFRPLYMFLTNVIIDLMHMCIKMQIVNKRDMKTDIETKLETENSLDSQSNFKFSLYSIEALTNECKECIEQAILTRQFYYHMVYSVFEKCEMDAQAALENDLVAYDDDLKKLIDIYLRFITDWIHDLVFTHELSEALRVLQAEWEFCKNNLYFVTASEDLYAKGFCNMSTFIFSVSLTNKLLGIDSQHKQMLIEYITNVEMNQDGLVSDDEYNMASLPVEIVHTIEAENEEEEEEEVSEEEVYHRGNAAKNQTGYADDYDDNEGESGFDITVKCNEFKEEINDLRKRTMDALEFCVNFLGNCVILDTIYNRNIYLLFN